MRELKFRYWNPYANKLVYNPTVFKEGWTLEQYFSDRGWAWEQYTGLKDKNGKEIYEGDIVKKTWFNGDDGDIAIIGVVGFNEEEASFGIVQTIQRTYEQYSGFYSQREVIGNIHENPELLDVKKEG